MEWLTSRLRRIVSVGILPPCGLHHTVRWRCKSFIESVECVSRRHVCVPERLLPACSEREWSTLRLRSVLLKHARAGECYTIRGGESAPPPLDPKQ